jgi:hypothetical protein
MSELGMRLVPIRERRTISRALLLEGCPGRTPDNRYHVARWQRFLDKIGTVGHTDDPAQKGLPAGIEGELKKERVRRERAEAERVERENAVAAGMLIRRDEAGDAIATALAALKTELLRLPGVLAPLVVGAPDPARAEVLIRGELLKTLRLLAAPKVVSLLPPGSPARNLTAAP